MGKIKKIPQVRIMKGIRLKGYWVVPIIASALILGNLDLAVSESVLFEYDFEFDSSSSSAGQLSFPFGITTDSSDRIIVVYANIDPVQVFDSTGVFLFEFGSTGTGPGQFTFPRDVTTDSTDRIIVSDTNNNRIQVFSLQTRKVDIDIKPSSETNCLNNNGHGVIPVAILGSADFDCSQVDPETVSLEGLSIKMVVKSNKFLAHYEDINHDGYDDLVLQIEDTDAVFKEGQTTATLTGNLYEEYGGTEIEGTDSICIGVRNRFLQYYAVHGQR